MITFNQLIVILGMVSAVAGTIGFEFATWLQERNVDSTSHNAR